MAVEQTLAFSSTSGDLRIDDNRTPGYVAPVIAVDVGGTHIRCAVARVDGTLTHFHKDRIVSVPLGASLADVRDALIETVNSYVERVAETVEVTSPITISVPGPVTRDGIVLTAAPLFADQCAELPLADLIHNRTGRSCYVVNDVSAAAWYLSSRIPAERFLVVTVSSGIGSKVFDRNRRYSVLDDMEYAGEIGHVTVDGAASAPTCDCGGRGHLSAFASGRAIERWARTLAGVDSGGFGDSLAFELSGGRAEDLTNERHIVPAVLAGDEWATAIVRRCTYPLGHMLRTIAVTNAVERVAIIGGFAASLGMRYLDILQETLDENRDFAILQPYLDSLLWREAEVPEECLLGAATYGRVRAAERRDAPRPS